MGTRNIALLLFVKDDKVNGRGMNLVKLVRHKELNRTII